MAIKYILENQIIEGRTIVDSVDKVHFRSAEVLGFGYNSETEKNDLVEVDLLKSNYFLLDLTEYSGSTITEAIYFDFLNVGETQRFEILLKTDSGVKFEFIWDEDYDIVFPWGEVSSPLNYVTESYQQNIITFRKGLMLDNTIQFVAIQSPWMVI